MGWSRSDQKAPELYYALGKAMSRWQYVETGMFLLFHGLSCSQFEEASHQFFETDRKNLRERKKPHEKKDLSTIGKKLSEINDLCRASLRPEIVSEHWEPLHTKLKQHRDIRNAIAHFEPGLISPPPEAGQGQARTGISPNRLDLTKVEDGGTVKALYVEQIFDAADEFLATAKELIKFIEDHIQNWDERVLILPDAAH